MKMIRKDETIKPLWRKITAMKSRVVRERIALVAVVEVGSCMGVIP